MVDLVVCCDGTWNTPDDLDGGLPAPTNVVKIYNALAATDSSGTEIRRYYHPGVGTDGSWWNRLAGGGMGVGLAKNVQSAYRWLAGAYRPGDRIWLFGFSRGAFTVRSLSGMISRCGLLDPKGMSDEKTWAAVEAIFADYRAKAEPKASKARPVHNAAAGAPARGSTPVFFIGVWDTVGALGIPDDMALLNLIDDPTKYAFHDTDLSASVVHARHAIAIDERRQSFMPTLWSDTPPEQDLKQEWFPGVHADVGGGYGRCGLSDGALKWMIDEASAFGLAFRANATTQIAPDPLGVLHDSMTGVFKGLKSLPRQAPCFDPAAPSPTPLHKSASDRHDNPPLSQLSYWPTILLKAGTKTDPIDIFAVQRWNATGVYLEAGVTYDFKAKGEWLDKSIACGPKGAKDGHFQAGEIAHVLSDGLASIQNLYRRATGNHQAEFWFTLREPDLDWFALIGMVASGEMFDKKGKLLGRPLNKQKAEEGRINERFLIGAAASFTPKRSGYLYCFANDAWQTYDNNRGSVRLTVSR